MRLMHRSTVLRCLYASVSKTGRTTADPASPETVPDLVRGLRNDGLNASAAKMPADCPR